MDQARDRSRPKSWSSSGATDFCNGCPTTPEPDLRQSGIHYGCSHIMLLMDSCGVWVAFESQGSRSSLFGLDLIMLDNYQVDPIIQPA